MAATPPEKPTLDGLEDRWSARWDDAGTYRFDRSEPRAGVYSIDTPPPTVSGSLHVGHVFSYTHTDTVARYKRMRGFDVFYPMGWDDNGLPTERRVQNYYGVRCDPTLHYDPDFRPPEKPGKQELAISRRNFVELCGILVEEDEKKFEELWRHAGLSVDWSMTYTTIGERARRAAQRGFLRLLATDRAYQRVAPTLWDVDFGTAVSQAELEDRELPGAYHAVRFAGLDGADDLVIETTRPELIPACVALVAHPDDARYRDRFGHEVRTPLFGVRVPVVAHELADPEKGSGIAMICTFGDVTDVTWWRELNLPVRAVVERDGRLRTLDWGRDEWTSDDPAAAQRSYDELAGRTTKQAQKRIVEMLRESGDLLGEPKPITHPVKFYERGERPLEIVTSRQWFIKTLDEREALLRRGSELRWHPPHMEARYRAWVEGLNGDWLISRQRYFGVPFPVWYPVRTDGTVAHDAPIVPEESALPVDPSSEPPAGYTEEQRGKPDGFVGDPDVMDTWATSSLTPELVSGWEEDPDLFARTFPMDLRPQAHEIIRTWLFSTIVRAHYEFDALPWRDVAISGWVLDPNRKKMSKSKGNVVTPMDHLQKFGSDAVRYWAASGRPGVDTAFDEGQMKVGRRLAIKILNASKFTLGVSGGRTGTADVSRPLDRAMLGRLGELVTDATDAFEGYDYARALERTERFFWSFCDDYLELVKGRAYGGADVAAVASAQEALATGLSVLQRLFAPFLPFVTEEVWSWWQDGSVHRSAWPSRAELGDATSGADASVFDVAADVLGAIRKAKSDQRRSLRTQVTRVVVRDTEARLAALGQAADDVCEAGNVASGALATEPGTELAVDVELAPPEEQ